MIKSLFIKPEKGAKAVEQKTLNLIKNKGAAGDAFAAGGERQISILYEETADKTKKFPDGFACVQKFSCNILFEGDIPKDLHAGSVIHINDAKLEVSQIGRKCHGICEKRVCPLVTGAIFAKVIEGGEISRGSSISYD